ncbi:MAG: glycosyltransferase family 2 protein [Clostridia bacterium]|nr:glycosyltransferase family 2 protein [Clostridia bacterium]
MEKVSLIICVYNTELSFFEECLNSIQNSSLKNYEIIVIDDGSSVDYSKLQKKFLRAKFIKTENHGTLSARLEGIKNATGDWIYFIDSDDTFSFDYVEAMLLRAQQTGADLVLNDWAFHTDNSKYFCYKDSTIATNFMLENEKILLKFFETQGREHAYFALWNKLFKKELALKMVNEIENLNISRLVFAEDMLMTYFLFKNATKLTNVHAGYYFYRMRNGSECSEDNSEKLKGHIEQRVFVFNLIEDDLKKQNKFEDVERNFKAWKVLDYTSNLQKIKHNKFTELENILATYQFQDQKIKKAKENFYYGDNNLLPKNLDQIDAELKKVFFANKHMVVYAKKNTYAFKQLVMFKKLFKRNIDLTNSKKIADVKIINEKYSLRSKLMHIPFFYKLGMILIPKGSKLRKKIKSKV